MDKPVLTSVRYKCHHLELKEHAARFQREQEKCKQMAAGPQPSGSQAEPRTWDQRVPHLSLLDSLSIDLARNESSGLRGHQHPHWARLREALLSQEIPPNGQILSKGCGADFSRHTADCPQVLKLLLTQGNWPPSLLPKWDNTMGLIWAWTNTYFTSFKKMGSNILLPKKEKYF